MRHANSRDRFIVDEVEVVPGIQNSGNDACAQQLANRLIERHVP